MPRTRNTATKRLGRVKSPEDQPPRPRTATNTPKSESHTQPNQTLCIPPETLASSLPPRSRDAPVAPIGASPPWIRAAGAGCFWRTSGSAWTSRAASARCSPTTRRAPPRCGSSSRTPTTLAQGASASASTADRMGGRRCWPPRSRSGRAQRCLLTTTRCSPTRTSPASPALETAGRSPRRGRLAASGTPLLPHSQCGACLEWSLAMPRFQTGCDDAAFVLWRRNHYNLLGCQLF